VYGAAAYAAAVGPSCGLSPRSPFVGSRGRCVVSSGVGAQTSRQLFVFGRLVGPLARQGQYKILDRSRLHLIYALSAISSWRPYKFDGALRLLASPQGQGQFELTEISSVSKCFQHGTGGGREGAKWYVCR
jgi:hypothetical protein